MPWSTSVFRILARKSSGTSICRPISRKGTTVPGGMDGQVDHRPDGVVDLPGDSEDVLHRDSLAPRRAGVNMNPARSTTCDPNDRYHRPAHSFYCFRWTVRPGRGRRKGGERPARVAWALTDHDTVAGLGAAAAAARTWASGSFPGIELSAFLDEREIHVLGHFVDPVHPELRDFEDMLADHRRGRVRQIVELLAENGVSVTEEAIVRLQRGQDHRPSPRGPGHGGGRRGVPRSRRPSTASSGTGGRRYVGRYRLHRRGRGGDDPPGRRGRDAGPPRRRRRSTRGELAAPARHGIRRGRGRPPRPPAGAGGQVPGGGGPRPAWSAPPGPTSTARSWPRIASWERRRMAPAELDRLEARRPGGGAAALAHPGRTGPARAGSSP